MKVAADPEQCDLWVSVNGEQHMPFREARQRLGIPRSTAYRWNEAGKINFVKIEGRVYCPAKQVMRLEAKKEAESDGRR